jgi:hypothetical protein
MMSTTNVLSEVSRASTAIDDRATRDESFRKQLLKEPRNALAEVMGAKLADDVSVEAHENTANTVNIVITAQVLADAAKVELPKSNERSVASITLEVLKKAATDDKFRQKLLKDAKTAVYDLTGVEMGQNLTMKVYENTPTKVHIVVPASPAAPAELTDSELDQIAGGKGNAQAGGVNISADNALSNNQLGSGNQLNVNLGGSGLGSWMNSASRFFGS